MDREYLSGLQHVYYVCQAVGNATDEKFDKQIVMKRALIVIDVQNYFMNSLTKHLPERILQYIQKNKGNFALIIFTNFVNTRESSVYRFLDWQECLGPPEEEFYLCGIDTDCCVLATAYDAFDQGYRVHLLKNLCMTSTGKNLHNAAVSMFKKNVGSVS